MRVGAVDAEGADTVSTAREMYVSLVVTRDETSEALRLNPEKEVSLRGVTVAFEFSRRVARSAPEVAFPNGDGDEVARTELADPSRFVFMCWGAQLMPASRNGSDAAHRGVPCSELALDMDEIGPKVTFGDATLRRGEFLVGGYSNFLFSFKERSAMPMEDAVTLLAPYCDVEALDKPASELALLAPTFKLGWNPNAHLALAACPALADMTFHSVIPEQADASTSVATGVVGHRTCATMDMTGIAVPLRYEVKREEGAPGGFDPEDFDVTCFGMRVALPSPAHRCCGADALAADPESLFVPCDDLDVVMASDGLRVGFANGEPVRLCPGCFLVGAGENNVIASWSLRSETSRSAPPDGAELSPRFSFPAAAPPAMPYCGAGADLAVPSPAALEPVTPCNAEENADIDGEVLLGGAFLTSSQGACCLACQENPQCNVWSFCTDRENGCGGNAHSYSYSECSLRYQDPDVLRSGPGTAPPGARGADVRRTSGAFPDKRVEPFVADTVQPVTEEAGETCALCLIEDAANYKGDPVADGTDLLRDSAEACCAACEALETCNAFVYCASPEGCGDGGAYQYKHRECWLKWMAPDLARQTPVPAWARGEGVEWVSGIVNRTRCEEAPVVEAPEPPPTVELPPAPVPAPTTPRSCVDDAARLRDLCGGVFLGQAAALDADDAEACCALVADMNARACFCDADVVDALEQLADPLFLVGGIVCDVEIKQGDACAAPETTPVPASPPPPTKPEQPPSRETPSPQSPDAPSPPPPAARAPAFAGRASSAAAGRACAASAGRACSAAAGRACAAAAGRACSAAAGRACAASAGRAFAASAGRASVAAAGTAAAADCSRCAFAATAESAAAATAAGAFSSAAGFAADAAESAASEPTGCPQPSPSGSAAEPTSSCSAAESAASSSSEPTSSCSAAESAASSSSEPTSSCSAAESAASSSPEISSSCSAVESSASSSPEISSSCSAAESASAARAEPASAGVSCRDRGSAAPVPAGPAAAGLAADAGVSSPACAAGVAGVASRAEGGGSSRPVPVSPRAAPRRVRPAARRRRGFDDDAGLLRDVAGDERARPAMLLPRRRLGRRRRPDPAVAPARAVPVRPRIRNRRGRRVSAGGARADSGANSGAARATRALAAAA